MDACCSLLDEVKEIAAEAGRRIVAIYDDGFTVRHKEDKTPLTEADLAAHRTISAGLQRLTPETPILSEESAAVPYEQRRHWTRYWLIDPLDGTREFIKRNGEFTVNIALIDGHAPILGVVLAPVTGISFYACRGGGAFKQIPGTPARPIHTARWRGGRIRIAGSRSHGSAAFDAFVTHFPDHERVSMGSSLKSCLVAEGAADVYPRFGTTSEWDTAAAQCVVEEAGGALTDLHLRRLRYNEKASLLNPHFIVYGDRHHDWSAYLAG